MMRKLILTGILSFVLVASAASAQRQGEISLKRRTEPPGYPHGATPDTALRAELEELTRLERAGDRKAVQALEEKLTSTYMPDWVKRGCLLALGHIGSRRAVAAVEAFETWAQARELATPPV